MFRILAGSILILAMTFALASASELKGKITKVTATTITMVTTSDSGQKGVTKTLTVYKDLMVFRLVKKKRVDVPDGLKSDDFKNLGSGGISATVIVNDDIRKVTEITLGSGKKK
jgi:hypothetical protein